MVVSTFLEVRFRSSEQKAQAKLNVSLASGNALHNLAELGARYIGGRASGLQRRMIEDVVKLRPELQVITILFELRVLYERPVEIYAAGSA
jgi:hypothetical protein